jgi:hypothetical protein
MRFSPALVALWAAALLVPIACSSSTPSGGDSDDAGGSGRGGDTGGSNNGGSSGVCVPGATEICTGENGCRGARVCNGGGTEWSSCDCGTSGGSGGAAVGGSAGTAGAATGGSSGSGTTGGTSGSGGGEVTPLPACTGSCSTAADCGAGTAADDMDNYRCEGGACVPLGCLSDAECTSQSPGTVCRPVRYLARSACIRACSVPADCATPLPSNDADNFRCTNGGCDYAGCNDTAECEGTYPGMTAVCADGAGTGVRVCTPTCTTLEDCSLGGVAVDADNYRCDNGLCVYLGCRSDSECAPALDICLGL